MQGAGSLQERSERFAELATELAGRDWALCRDFIPEELVTSLRREALELRAAGQFRPAGIGQVAERHSEVRGDELLWLKPEMTPGASRLMQGELEALRYAVNTATLLGLHELEAHYTVYPPGARYLKHLDRFRDDDRRVISIVLYLNEAWREEDGGELTLYPAAGATPVKIAPSGGSLVCFLSDRVPHEVLPARRLRLSLTGWFRKRA